MQQSKPQKSQISQKAASFTESVIREMSREAVKYGAVNLGQGFPDWPAPESIKQKAQEAIAADHNQYAVTWGVKEFRDAIAAKTKRFLGLDVDPESELTVTCGSTEGMIAAALATIDPGDEVVVFDPYYENYMPDTIISGARPRFAWSAEAARCRLHPCPTGVPGSTGSAARLPDARRSGGRARCG